MGYKIIPSAPLVHPVFPTSFNMSAGLVQLDPRIRSPIKIKPFRECLIQKCVRHFDINKVGDDTHLSFFEMAGAFEVGDFNDIKTISNIWNFLIKNLRIDSNKIWVTAFNKEIIYDKKIELPENLKKFLFKIAGKHLVYGDKNTNFWTQGGGAEFSDNIKLCGPQVEFFYDRGINKKCKKKNCNPLCPCERFMEIGNCLLIYYYIDPSQNKLAVEKLANPSTEVVIGLERCTSIVEETNDIYKSSLFRRIAKIFDKSQTLNIDQKIIIDHLKSLCFIFSEGKITISKEGRGRVIRTLVRRLLNSFYILDLNQYIYIPKLIQEVMNTYEKGYPEIRTTEKIVENVIFEHELLYKKSIRRGIRNIKRLGILQTDLIWKNFGIPERLAKKILC